MAGWELMPAGSTDIYESNQLLERKGVKKVIGQFTHYRVNKDGVLTGLQVKDGAEMRITKEHIFVEGYEKPWQAVSYMNTNQDRKKCAMWVWQLICEGKFGGHR